jgi:hypothetical protein
LFLAAQFVVLRSLLLRALLLSVLNSQLPISILLYASLLLLLCSLLLAILFLLPVSILLGASLLLLLCSLLLAILFLLPVSILLGASLLLLLCSLLLAILFLLLRFSLSFPALILLFISILLGALFSALVSLSVLFWLLLCGLSIPLLLCFIFILLVRLLGVRQGAGTENEQQSRSTDKFDRFHHFASPSCWPSRGGVEKVVHCGEAGHRHGWVQVHRISRRNKKSQETEWAFEQHLHAGSYVQNSVRYTRNRHKLHTITNLSD